MPAPVEAVVSEAGVGAMDAVLSGASDDTAATRDAMEGVPVTLVMEEVSAEVRLQRLPRFVPPSFYGPLPVPESPEDSQPPTPESASPRTARLSYVVYVQVEAAALSTQEVPLALGLQALGLREAPQEPEREEDCITARVPYLPEVALQVASVPLACVPDDESDESDDREDAQTAAEPEEEREEGQSREAEVRNACMHAFQDLENYIQQAHMTDRPFAMSVRSEAYLHGQTRPEDPENYIQHVHMTDRPQGHTQVPWPVAEDEEARPRPPILAKELWLRLDELDVGGDDQPRPSVPPSAYTYCYSASNSQKSSGSESCSSSDGTEDGSHHRQQRVRQPGLTPLTPGWCLALASPDAAGAYASAGHSTPPSPTSIEACSPLRQPRAPDPGSVPPPLLLGRLGGCATAAVGRPAPLAGEGEPEALPSTPLVLQNAPVLSPMKSVRYPWTCELPHWQRSLQPPDEQDLRKVTSSEG